MTTVHSETHTPPSLSGTVAIIGMAGRFPGADDVATLWRHVCEGRDVRGADGAPGSGYVLQGLEDFAADFFDVPPRQASMLDPQHRLFLEVVWHALEDAGYVPDRCPGHVGIYAGSNFNNYLFHVADHYDLDAIDTYLEAMIASDKDYLTSRVAHKLGLSGPAVSVSTSCSTSLVAIATACQGLLDLQCDMAIAGGAGLNVPQQRIYRDYQEGGMSRDGACHAFDADATGVVHGSGVGVLVLKRTEDALRDGDAIVALVRGFAVNNDGARKVGYSAPSVEGQAEVLAEALAMAGVDAASVGYIEAHGTGTPVGDPIEFAALSRVYGAQGDKRCVLGSLKTHVGHLGAAAGVAGCIAAALALQHGRLPPMLHYRRPNPEIDLAASPFEVLTQVREWPGGHRPRRAGVSSFGIGGTNAHLVLEEAPVAAGAPAAGTPAAGSPAAGTHLALLSARSGEALDRMAQRLADHLDAHPGAAPADIAFTLARGRKAFRHRRSLAFDSVPDLTAQLRKPVRAAADEGRSPPSVGFMYPGIGAQHLGMGAALYRQAPVYRDAIDRCAALLQPLLGRDIRSALQSADEAGDAGAAAAADLADAPFGMACVVAVEIALTELWRSRGVQPACLIGHSLGEYAAAWAAGVFTLGQVLELVVLRGELIRRTQEGAMLVVSLDEAALRALLPAGLSIAAVNAERLCMVSGAAGGIADFERLLGEAKVVTQRLGVDRAAHSQLLEPVLGAFRAAVSAMALQPPAVPFVSNLTGTWITDDEARSPDYWVRHMRETVRFADGVALLLEEGRHALLELGPGRGLATLARRHPLARRGHCIQASLHGGDKAGDDGRAFAQALGALWCTGVAVDAVPGGGQAGARRLALPGYPFERQRHWLERRRAAPAPAGLERRSDVDSWFYAPSWRQACAPLAAAPVPPGVEWLFGVEGEWLDALDSARRGDGHTVLNIEAAQAWERVSATHYRIRPGSEEDHRRLFAAALADYGPPVRIVHAWALAPLPALGPQDEPLASPAHQRGHAALLCLARALSAHGLSGAGIVVLSSQVFGVTGQERLLPEKATLLGACRTWPYEFPQQGFLHIDLDERPLPGAWIDGLMRDINGAPQCTGQLLSLAWRQGRRWRFGIEALQMPAHPGRTPTVRDQGLYLVTGGFGGIGGLAAQWLAGCSQRPRLVLLGRTALPPRAQWPALLAEGGADASVLSRIRQVQGLEALGAEVEAVQADVGDRLQMQAARARIAERFGDAVVRGIVHAAGVPGGGLMQLEDSAADTRNLQAKVAGTRLLAECFDSPALDFMILCSSLGALAGTLGQAENTAANAFLDAYAQAGLPRAGVARSVNWDYWLQVGMIVALAERHHRITGGAMETGILPSEAPACLERVLLTGLPQVAVSTADLHALLAARAEAAGQALALFESADLRRDAAAPARPLDGPPYAAPANAIERVLALLWQERLGLERVGRDDEFLALGGDSMLALPLMAEMREALQFDLSVRALFAEQTIARIAHHIESHEARPGLAERVAAVYLQVRGMSPEQVASALSEEVSA